MTALKTPMFIINYFYYKTPVCKIVSTIVDFFTELGNEPEFSWGAYLSQFKINDIFQEK